MPSITAFCNIQLDIQVKADFPMEDQLFITGNLPQFGNWDPSGFRLPEIEPGHYQVNVAVEPGSIIECKLTRGTWKTQGIYDRQDIPPSNLVIRAESDAIIPVTIIDWLDQQVLESDPVCGELVVINHLAAPGLKYQRPLTVWLPENYSEFKAPAAVLYMHDGQNLFEPSAAFAGVDWKVDETVGSMIAKKKIRNCIVVGIANSPDRMQELNLFSDKGKAYADYVVNVVKPYIDSHFNVDPRPESTFIMGSSMGGLMSFQMSCFLPGIFGGAGCLSSAFWKTSERVFSTVEKSAFFPDNLKLYLDTGEFEPPIAKAYFRMMKLLKSRGYIEGYNLMGYYDEAATHCEAAWARRLHLPLQFLLSHQNSGKK